VTDPTFRDRVKGELNEPEWAASFEAELDLGQITFGYNLRWLGQQTIDFWETFFETDGRPPTDPDKFPVIFTPDTFYHAIRIGFEPTERFNFYVGVDNVFNTSPPYGFDGTCATGGVFACGAGGVGTPVFENIGRFFYAGASVRF